MLSAAFVGYAFWHSRQQDNTPVQTVAVEPPPPPPPPPPKFNCPLNGTEQPTKAATLNRPVIVQIDNAPDARPQSGLSQADMVYEAEAEGQITRYSAIFACSDSETVGPVRSARLIDLELVPEYTGLLANSGSSEGTTARLEADAAEVPNINFDNAPQAYRRVSDRFAPHNLMTGTTELRQAAADRGNATQVQIAGPLFKPDTPGAASIKSIAVTYSPYADVSYAYDAKSNSWLRSVGGLADKDDLNGAQIAPKNVIIQYVQVTTTNIIEDTSGERGLDYTLTGSGKVVVFRDGQAIAGQWHRTDKNTVTTYLDATGQLIPLNVGQTWVQVVPTDFQATWG